MKPRPHLLLQQHWARVRQQTPNPLLASPQGHHSFAAAVSFKWEQEAVMEVLPLTKCTACA